MESLFLLSGTKVNILECNISPIYSCDYDHYIIFKQLYNSLTETKNKIDLIEKTSSVSTSSASAAHKNLFNRNIVADDFELVVDKNVAKVVDNWNSVKKLTNTYEMVHTHNRSVAYYIPVSRSYFKMIEISHDLELFADFIDRPITIVAVAEAPGGFIEYINKYRSTKEDHIYGLTLRGDNSTIPSWHKLNNVLAKKNNRKPIINLSYGNLYNTNEINQLAEKIGKKAELVTADGGFDYTTNFNYQEQESYRLIYSEILSALSLQEEGGNFVCKIFDIFSVLTLKMIYIVYCMYEKVYIYKPKTSRLANSEKYLVALRFKGIPLNLSPLSKLTEIHKNWGNGVIDLEGIVLPSNFIQSIYAFNINFVKNQIDNINLTLSMITTPPTKAIYNKITNQQITHALEWCEKYNEPINHKWSAKT